MSYFGSHPTCTPVTAETGLPAVRHHEGDLSLGLTLTVSGPQVTGRVVAIHVNTRCKGIKQQGYRDEGAVTTHNCL